MLDADRVERYIERGTIEIAPLAFMRGRTLNDAFIILDEAQNTTTEQMKMFLTRIGFGIEGRHHRRHDADRPAVGPHVGPGRSDEGRSATSTASRSSTSTTATSSATSSSSRLSKRTRAFTSGTALRVLVSDARGRRVRAPVSPPGCAAWPRRRARGTITVALSAIVRSSSSTAASAV